VARRRPPHQGAVVVMVVDYAPNGADWHRITIDDHSDVAVQLQHHTDYHSAAGDYRLPIDEEGER
jgi:hypothetical protein